MISMNTTGSTPREAFRRARLAELTTVEELSATTARRLALTANEADDVGCLLEEYFEGGDL